MRLLGRYRVSLNGFRCNISTWDDALNRDGFGDEVFFQIEYRYADSNGDPMGAPVSRVTRTIGAPGNGRYAFGTAKDFFGNLQYGIASGDEFPGPHPYKRVEPFPNPEDVPPLLIWEGNLVSDWDGEHTDYWIGRQVTHENIVFITPTIWERDPGSDAMEGWLQWQVKADAQFGQKAKEIVSGRWPLAAPVFDAVSLGIQTVGSLDNIRGRAGTRPIGTQRDENTGMLSFTPKILTLTQAHAEEIIATKLGNEAGVLPYNYKDADVFDGDYDFWLQVERVGILRELPPQSGSTPASPISPGGSSVISRLAPAGTPLIHRPRN